MIKSNSAEVVPIDRKDAESPYYACCSLYRQRMEAVALIKQINYLMVPAQQHRGLSMAILGGEVAFESDFLRLQEQLDRRVLVFESFSAESYCLLTEAERSNLVNAWLTLKRGWQDDQIMDNFELHGHFIDQLLLLISQLAKKLERPMSDYLRKGGSKDEAWVNRSGNGSHRIKQLGLLVFVCKQMPDLVELIAKIRGLATHAMVIGRCEFRYEQKLKYLLRCAKEQREKLNLGIVRVDGAAKEHIPSLSMIKAYDIKLQYMIDKVEQDVLSSQVVSDDQQRFFGLASEIIDVYVGVIGQGLDMLQRWQEQQLEEWLAKG